MTVRVTKVTDGTDIVDFEDASSGYTIISHRLAVAERVDGLVELYGPVDEVIELSVEGSTPTELAQRLDRLTRLVDKARRLWRGEALTPVIFQYRIDNSTLTNPLQALVMGAPESGDVLTLPESFDNYTQLKTGDAGDPVVWRFRRRGALLGDEESDASSSTANPGVMTATNTATDLPSPVKLTLSNYTGQPWGGSFLLVTDDADKLDIFDITAATATGFTAVNDSGAKPHQGTNILRYTPTDTDWHYSGNVNVDAKLLSTTRKIAVYGSFRRNAVGVTAQAKVKFLPYLTSGYNTIGAVETTPVILEEIHEQWYFLGSVTLPIDISVADEMRLSVALKTSAAASSVDINAIALMDISTRASQAIFMPRNDTWKLITTLTIDHRLLTKTSPIVFVDGTYQYAIPAEGGIIISTSAAEVAAVWLSSGAYAPVAQYYWCAINPATIDQLSNVLTAIRRPAYLVPQ